MSGARSRRTASESCPACCPAAPQQRAHREAAAAGALRELFVAVGYESQGELAAPRLHGRHRHLLLHVPHCVERSSQGVKGRQLSACGEQGAPVGGALGSQPLLLPPPLQGGTAARQARHRPAQRHSRSSTSRRRECLFSSSAPQRTTRSVSRRRRRRTCGCRGRAEGKSGQSQGEGAQAAAAATVVNEVQQEAAPSECIHTATSPQSLPALTWAR